MIVIVMGVSGSGKSTVGKMLASEMNWAFSDADTFHSPENLEKMSKGIPLDDADRIPWLLAIQQAISAWLKEDRNAILACSALKSTYRQILVPDPQRIKLVYLKGSFDLIQKRLARRQNHFMHQDLLSSQFDTLEEPEGAIYLDASLPPEAIVQQIKMSLSGVISDEW